MVEKEVIWGVAFIVGNWIWRHRWGRARPGEGRGRTGAGGLEESRYGKTLLQSQVSIHSVVGGTVTILTAATHKIYRQGGGACFILEWLSWSSSLPSSMCRCNLNDYHLPSLPRTWHEWQLNGQHFCWFLWITFISIIILHEYFTK